MPRHDPTFWSSCHGALVDYIGYYKCRECEQRLHPRSQFAGQQQEPYMLSEQPGKETKVKPRDVQPMLSLEVPR